MQKGSKMVQVVGSVKRSSWEAVAGLFALRFAILAYAQMHVCMGLELAIDAWQVKESALLLSDLGPETRNP